MHVFDWQGLMKANIFLKDRLTSMHLYILIYHIVYTYTTFLTLYIMIERPHGNIVFYDEINNNQKICAEINFLF